MRKLMWFTIGFAASCLLAGYIWIGNIVFLLAAASLALGICAALFLKRKCPRGIAVLTLLGMSIGFAWFGIFDAVYMAPARALDGKTVEMEVYVTSVSWESEFGGVVDGQIGIEGRSYDIRVYMDEYIALDPNSMMQISMELRLTTDGRGNEPTYHRSNGIELLGYQTNQSAITIQLAEADFWVLWICNARMFTADLIRKAYAEDTQGFALALLLGDKSNLSYDQYADLKTAGLSHVVAVSGLHVSILFSLVYLLTGKRRGWTALIGIPAVIAFMALAGFAPSVVRAGIMQILMMVALLVGREYDVLTALAFSVLLMLGVNPLAATGVAFQLSVCSIIGIQLFYEKIRLWIYDKLAPKGKFSSYWSNWLSSGLAVTAAAQLMTTPLVAIYFGMVSIAGVFMNLLVIWLVSLIFYGVVLSMPVTAISPLVAGFLGKAISFLIRFVFAAADLVSDLPFAAVYTDSVFVVIWLVAVYLAIFALATGWIRKPIPVICGCILGLCCAMMLSWAEPRWDDCRVTVLDVGQGQSVLLQTGGKTFVVDCGGDYDDDAADAAASKLLSMGISRVDGVILTHYDRDHAGGIPDLLTRVTTDALFLPATEDAEQIRPKILAAAPDAQIFSVEQDMLIEAEGMKITLYAPEGAAGGNESCVAVLFQTEKCDTLITGDLSAFWERVLVYEEELPELEVLMVGHHGSGSSTSEELLAATTPEVAIISVGEKNYYGHPSGEVIQRLNQYGCRILRTDESGTIIYRG